MPRDRGEGQRGEGSLTENMTNDEWRLVLDFWPNRSSSDRVQLQHVDARLSDEREPAGPRQSSAMTPRTWSAGGCGHASTRVSLDVRVRRADMRDQAAAGARVTASAGNRPSVVGILLAVLGHRGLHPVDELLVRRAEVRSARQRCVVAGAPTVRGWKYSGLCEVLARSAPSPIDHTVDGSAATRGPAGEQDSALTAVTAAG